MSINLFRIRITQLLSALVVSFLSLNPARAELLFNVPVTAGNVSAQGSLVIGMRLNNTCDIRANGVQITVTPTLNAFICQLKLLGATNLGTMTIDSANPGRHSGYNFTSTAADTTPNMVKGVAVFDEVQQRESGRSTYIRTTMASPAPANNGVLMNSPDQAVVAATAAVRNRPVTLGYFTGNMPVFYSSEACADSAGDFTGLYSYNILANITMQ